MSLIVDNTAQQWEFFVNGSSSMSMSDAGWYVVFKHIRATNKPIMLDHKQDSKKCDLVGRWYRALDLDLQFECDTGLSGDWYNALLCLFAHGREDECFG